MSRTLLIDWMEEGGEHTNDDWSEVINTIREHFNLTEHLVAVKIKYCLSYKASVYYALLDYDDLGEWLDQFIQTEDCKNGIQLYQDDETGEKYLCVTGQNYYDRDTDKYKGTDEVHLYFKEYVW